ncbi:MAG TPA: hypothetical protein PKK42_11435 [Leptospiraceae bacterium]|nr:hypothetical protein [Leptospiraceae bacterium]
MNKIKSFSLTYISDACKKHPNGKEGIANALNRDIKFLTKLYDDGSVMQAFRIAKQLEDMGL